MVTKTKMTEVEKLQNLVKGLKAKVVELESRPVRDRGPKSTRTMTEEDARKISIGNLKESSHKEAALKLGLSYGQIYSARFGFTFKKVYKEAKK